MNTFRIKSNLTSAFAYRNLSKSQFNLQTTLERLSSGLRINKAADDSAGSAISTRMFNQMQGVKQANENSQQANNLIQTAESGLSGISGMLTRMRELATQAATDTLNNSDRASINLEFQTLKNEISRVAHATEYNEMSLLNGTDYKNEVHRANTTADDVIGISVKNANLSHDIRKGVYTLKDEHIDVSGLADISKLSDTAITGIRYSSSSFQPALGETYSIKSQVNSGIADIDNLSITDVSELRHSTSPIVLPGDHTIISRLDASDLANISRLSGTSITEIRHNASSVVQPGDHTIISRLDASDPANISGLSGTSITQIRHNASSVVQLGDHTLSTRLDASDPVNISGLSGTSITEIRHDVSSVVQPGDHEIIARLDVSDRANISGLSGTSITEIRHDASPLVRPGDHMIRAKVSAGIANVSNFSGTAIGEIRHDASTEGVPVTPGDYTVSVTEDKRDYRLILRSSGDIELETTSDGTAWTLASSDTFSASGPNSVSGNHGVTFRTTDGKDVTVTFPDSDSDGVLDFKDSYPVDASKVKDLPGAFSNVSGDLKLWLDSREWSAIDADNWVDFSGKSNHISQSGLAPSQTFSTGTMFVVTKSGALNLADSNAGGIQLSDATNIDEVLVFDRVLTDAEKAPINDYLAQKWGLNTGQDQDLARRIIVAGGGGGGSYPSKLGGSGGGLQGGQGDEGSNVAVGGTGGAQSAGGEANSTSYGATHGTQGQGGSGSTGNAWGSGGGGGGYYGGGGGTMMAEHGSGYAAGGGGGSSYIGGVSNGSTQSGVRSGDGSAEISYDGGNVTFDYTGSVQTFTTPAGVTEITIEVWGAQGGATGGNGGYATGQFQVTSGQIGHVYVGGQGEGDNSQDRTNLGGWNGGGSGGYDTSGQVQNGGGGGGASDVRFGEVGSVAGTKSGLVDGYPSDQVLDQFSVSFSREMTVTPSGGGTSETVNYDYTGSPQTSTFSDLGFQIDVSDGTVLGDQMAGNPRIFTVNPTLEVTAPNNTTVTDVNYSYSSSPQAISVGNLGLTIDTSDAQVMTNSLLNNSKSFTVDARLRATAPNGATEEIPYSSSSESQTVSFNTLGLEVDSDDAEQTARQLLNHSQEFTVDTRLKAVAPDGTEQEVPYSSSSESQTVNFTDLGLSLDSSNAEGTATSLLENSKGFRVNPTMSVTAHDNTVAKSVYEYDSSSQTVTLSGLGLQVETDNAIAMTSSLLDNAEDFTVDARLRATAPNGATEEIKYSSSSESQTVDFDTLGLEVDSDDAEQTARQLLNHSQEFTVDTRLKASIPDGTEQEIKYSSSSESQTVSFSDLGLDVDSDDAQTTATQLLNISRDFTVNPTLAINSPNTAPVEETGYQFHDSPQTVGFSRLGLEVDTSDASGTTTTLLGAPQDFFVPETRKLTMTGENGMEQSLEYRVGYDTTLNFDEFGIQLDIKSSPDPAIPSADSYNPHNDSLDGTQIEISPNRDLQVGADNDVNHQLKLGITSVTSSGLEIEDESVLDIDQARAAITALDTAIYMVNEERSYLASEQNRLAFTMSNLASQAQNIESSRSSIQDADFASEAMNMTKAQILSQSSSAMLVQANALTQNILSLLR
ncbi:hypothetical protein CMK22_12065 [Candidatus Poribacteria bacterium]|nr:hypothetical protein [Candidatus Poribacteria bacterium]